jgi:hypothetical protein
VGLGQHDHHGRVRRLVPQHPPEVGDTKILGTLRRDVVSHRARGRLPQCDWRRVDVVAVALGDPEADAVVGIRVDVDVAISIPNIIALQPLPLRVLVGVEEATPLLPFEIDPFIVDIYTKP